MHSADDAVARCLSVCPSVSLSVCHTQVFCRRRWTYPQKKFYCQGCRAVSRSSQELKSLRCRGGWCRSAENAGHGVGGPNRRARNYITIDKKLSCRRETARCSMSLNISLSHSMLLKTVQSKAWYGFLFAFHIKYDCVLYRFRDRDIGLKSRFFSYPLHSTPTLGSLHWNIAIRFSVEN